MKLLDEKALATIKGKLLHKAKCGAEVGKISLDIAKLVQDSIARVFGDIFSMFRRINSYSTSSLVQ